MKLSYWEQHIECDLLFSSCPPRTFLPALCKIFLDECAPDNVLEVTARAITYYLDVSGKPHPKESSIMLHIENLCLALILFMCKQKFNLIAPGFGDKTHDTF